MSPKAAKALSPAAQDLVTSTPLFEIVAAVKELENRIAAAGGELTEETEKELLQVDLAVAQKVDAYAYTEDHLKSEAEFWDQQAKLAAKVSKGLTAARERLKARIKEAMQEMQKTEVLGLTRRYVLSPNAGSLKVDQTKLPKEYLIVETVYTPDTKRIREELQALKEIPGASIEGGYTLNKYANRSK